MKRIRVSICLFLIAFGFTYIGLCYFMPGWRIKLEADSLTYFFESLKKIAPIKFLVSLGVGLVISFIPVIMKKVL